GQVAQVVVEDVAGSRVAAFRGIEHRLVLEEVLATLDRPDLPVRQLADDRLRERVEVTASGRGTRVEDEDVGRLQAPRLDDPDLVEIRRSPLRGEAVDHLETLRDLRRCSGRGEAEQEDDEDGACRPEGDARGTGRHWLSPPRVVGRRKG